MLHDSFYEDMEKLFAIMEQEFDAMEQSMFMQWPVQEFEFMIHAEDFPSHETAKGDFPRDFPQDVPKPDLPHQETLANQNFSKTMKKIPYEGPDEN